VTANSTSVAPQWTTRFFGPNLGRVAAVAGAGLLFGVLLLAVRLRWLPLEVIDRNLDAALNRVVAGHKALVNTFGAISRLGSHGVLGWLIAIPTVLLTLRRRYRLAAYLVVTGVGALILDPTLKAAVGRLRPVVDHPIAVGLGNSFPSGHALDSIVVYGALLMVFEPALPARARKAVIGGVALIVAAIGFSRLALGVHFLSDVLGAWALGVAWLGITAYAFELWRRDHGRRVTRPLSEGLEPEAVRDLKPAGGPAIAAEVVRTRLAIAGALVSWVLVFGALCAMGIPLARYEKGNGNILGDRTIPHWLAAHRTPELNHVSYLGSQAGNTHMILAVGLVAGSVALAVIRQWRPIVFLLATMFGELTLFLASAMMVDRARPDVPHLDGRLPTSSYPSGHVAATILLYTAIAVLVFPRTRAWWRWLPVAAAVLMPLWVATSRLYRGMHHPTDILGSLLLAAAWIAVTIYFVRPNCDLQAGLRADPRAGPRAGKECEPGTSST
jgi:undecaprenyl-diphosphatase